MIFWPVGLWPVGFWAKGFWPDTSSATVVRAFGEQGYVQSMPGVFFNMLDSVAFSGSNDEIEFTGGI